MKMEQELEICSYKEY